MVFQAIKNITICSTRTVDTVVIFAKRSLLCQWPSAAGELNRYVQNGVEVLNSFLGKFGIYYLPPSKKSYIKKHFFQFSLGKNDIDFVPDKQFFNKLKHPAELFYLAIIYNWDDGPEVLKWVIESPLCTRSTASLIFWRAAPDFYLEYELDGNNESLNDHDLEVLALLSKILERFKQNKFNKFNINFDPRSEIEEIRSKDPKWEIPKALYQKVEGIVLF